MIQSGELLERAKSLQSPSAEESKGYRHQLGRVGVHPTHKQPYKCHILRLMTNMNVALKSRCSFNSRTLMRRDFTLMAAD